MRMPSVSLLAALALASTGFGAARADGEPPPPTISISASGSVDYAPDIARLSVGVRAESSTANAAASAVNAAAQNVVTSIRNQGIRDADIKTSGYSLFYREPPQPPRPLPPAEAPGAPRAPAPAPTGVKRGFPGEARNVTFEGGIVLPGAFVASETVTVKSPVDKAGALIDAAIGAGANQSYGITFDTTQRERLYRQALAKAVQSARGEAELMASAAGVRIVGVQSMSTGEFGRPVLQPLAALSVRAAPAPPVLAGTDQVTASVTVVYRIR